MPHLCWVVVNRAERWEYGREKHGQGCGSARCAIIALPILAVRRGCIWAYIVGDDDASVDTSSLPQRSMISDEVNSKWLTCYGMTMADCGNL